MKDVGDIRMAYFIGIGGIGMSALARYFAKRGIRVSGYDKTRTEITDSLSGEGIHVHFDDDLESVPGEMKNPENKPLALVVYTPAVPPDHNIMQFFMSNGFDVVKRSQLLGFLTKGTFTVAVAGTHGKTTTSSMIAHMLHSSGKKCTAFLGGISLNFNSNLVLSPFSDCMVVEADEYDRSFHALYPDYAVVTSVDDDHLDVYQNRETMLASYGQFVDQIKTSGKFIVNKKAEGSLPSTGRFEKVTYALDNVKADYYAHDISVKKGCFHFSVTTPTEKIENITLSVPGRHNIENSLAAIAVGKLMGTDTEAVRSSLAAFKGVKRRFEYHIKNDRLVFIDDYAHHPEELKACIGAAKELYPGKRITGIFQPHLYSRTRDFAEDFARSLEMLDELILLEIYPARETPLPGVNSEMLLKKVRLKNKMLCPKESINKVIAEKKPEVLLTMGAGDIDQCVEPLKRVCQAMK